MPSAPPHRRAHQVSSATAVVSRPLGVPHTTMSTCALVDVSPFGATARRARARSVASGQDADTLEAVDLDQFFRAKEMEVLALRRLSALGAADANDLDNPSVSGDAIAGTNTTGKGDLRSSRLGHDHSLPVRRGSLQPLGWPVERVGGPESGRRPKMWSLARAVLPSPAAPFGAAGEAPSGRRNRDRARFVARSGGLSGLVGGGTRRSEPRRGASSRGSSSAPRLRLHRVGGCCSLGMDGRTVLPGRFRGRGRRRHSPPGAHERSSVGLASAHGRFASWPGGLLAPHGGGCPRRARRTRRSAADLPPPSGNGTTPAARR